MLSVKNLLILAALPLLASPALATEGGSESGGGENSVVCFNDPAIPSAIRDPNSPHFGQIFNTEIPAISSLEAYDLYEAKIPHGLTNRTRPQIVDIGANENARDYVEKIAKRFEPYVPYVAMLVRRGAGVFTDNRILARPAGLKRIHDENDVGSIDAGHCVVATMAAQYFAGSEPQLQFDDRLFSHPLHSSLSQGVLVLHESIYYTARNSFRHEDSRATRKLVSTLINAAPTNTADVINLLGSLKLTETSYPTSDWFAKNYAEIMLDKFMADSTPALDKALKARHTQNNNALAQRYNAWLDTYFNPANRAKSKFGWFMYRTPEKAKRNKNGNYESVSDLLDNGNKTCWDLGTGCEAALHSLEKRVVSNKADLRQKAVQLIQSLANDKLFPALAQLPQFDDATKTKTQELMAAAIQKGNVHLEEIPDGQDKDGYDKTRNEYRFDPEENSVLAIRSMAITIP